MSYLGPGYIFIHVPKTGGTSIRSLLGIRQDSFLIKAHSSAAATRAFLYAQDRAEYWDKA